MDQTYMKEQPVLKLIVSMALPMVISMMVSSLYNIVDSYFVARISENRQDQRRCHDGVITGVSSAESDQCGDDRIWNRNQCGHLILSWSAG